MSFLYTAAQCWWNHGNGMEEYLWTVKQFIDSCAGLYVLLHIPANMEGKRRRYYGSRCIQLTAWWLALTLGATQQLTSGWPKASWSSCWLKMTTLTVACSHADKTRWAANVMASTPNNQFDLVLKFKVTGSEVVVMIGNLPLLNVKVTSILGEMQAEKRFNLVKFSAVLFQV